MKKIYKIALVILLSCLVWQVRTQGIDTLVPNTYSILNTEKQNSIHNCISPEQYAIINARVEANVKMLKEKGILKSNQPEEVVSFNWPLKQKAGISDPSYYVISNYVDENSGSGILDYNCGNRSYDSHQGTDIALWPFGWDKMNNDEVEIIAAAPGVIVERYDGNFDKNCVWGGQLGNGVVIQHSDGTRAIYWHMKKNSVTSSTVGTFVNAGTYLGRVGSSGISSGPHLHFEVLLGENQSHVDPWLGNCNIGQSWWNSQKSYYDPKICKIMTHNTTPVLSQCSDGEFVNASNTFEPGQLVYFAGYFRDYLPQTNAIFQVKRPDGSIWQTWTVQNVYSFYNNAHWQFSNNLPTNATLGTWVFSITYQGQTVNHNFTVQGSSCSKPILAYTTNITNTTATINWSSVNGSQGFQIQKKIGVNGVWEDVATTLGNQSSYVITGLVPNTAGYYLRVRTICGVNNFSDWNTTLAFNTLSNCTTPTGLSTTNINSNSITLNWVSTGAPSYTVELRHVGSPFWYKATSTSLNYLTFLSEDINYIDQDKGLASNTNYEWHVRANCSNQMSSSWSSNATFITPSQPCNSVQASDIILESSNNNSLTVKCTKNSFQYLFRIRKLSYDGSGSFQVNASTSNIRSYNNLDPCTIYQVQCAVRCQSGGSWAPYSASQFFTTGGCTTCGNPSNLSLTNQSSNAVTLNWSSVSGALNYSIEWKVLGEVTWQTLSGGPFTGTSKVVSLSGTGTIQWRVKANCSGNNSGNAVEGPNIVLQPTAELLISPSSKNVSASAGSESFSVTSNISWTASDDASWVTISPLSGSNNGTITTTFSANTSSNSRTALITVTGGGITKTVTLMQAGATNQNCTNDNEASNNAMSTAPLISLNSDKISQIATSTDFDNWKFTLPTSQNVDITLTNLPSDYDVKLFNSNYTQIGISANGNTSNESINKTLSAGTYYVQVFGYNGVYSTTQCYTLRVSAGTANTLSVSPTSKNVSSATGSEVFSISSNVSWSVSDDASWLTLSPANGANNGLFTANFTENFSTSSRTATISITGGGITQTVTLTQSGISNCSIPTGFQTTNITQTSAIFNWNAVSGASTYALQTRTSPNGQWYDTSPATFSGNSISINGFSPGTNYDWRVKTNCSNGMASNWSTGNAFTTLSSTCNVPTGLQTTNITQTTVLVSWTPVSNAQSYTLQTRLSPNGQWYDTNPSTFTGTSRTITGLNSGTTYEWRVKTNCTNGSSNWTNGMQFITLAVTCQAPISLQTSNITQNTADLSWASISGAISYQVQFSLNGTWSNIGNPVTTNTMGVYGLVPNASYQWRVITICANNQQSNPSNSNTFYTPTVPNCTGGIQYPTTALTPNANWQYQTQIWGGEYSVFNVQDGVTYTFSYCSTNGASLSFDGQMSIRSMNDQLLSYSDNYCGTAPKIVWQSTITGQIRVLLSKFNCSTQQTNSTLAYKTGSAFTGDLEERSADLEYQLLAPINLETASVNQAIKSPLQNYENNLEISIYPNPTTDFFNILVSQNSQSKISSIQIYDQLGRLKWEQFPANNSLDEMIYQVDVSNWNMNTYFVRVTTDLGQIYNDKVQIIK